MSSQKSVQFDVQLLMPDYMYASFFCGAFYIDQYLTPISKKNKNLHKLLIWPIRGLCFPGLTNEKHLLSMSSSHGIISAREDTTVLRMSACFRCLWFGQLLFFYPLWCSGTILNQHPSGMHTLVISWVNHFFLYIPLASVASCEINWFSPKA